MVNPIRIKESAVMIHGELVAGVGVDGQTRCIHYHSHLDVIAIKFKCCGEWFPCYECHGAVADHEPTVWPLSDFGQKAILCGACGEQLSIQAYLDSESTCPVCEANFNPGCANHYDLYFEK
jgi:uncharacterized CHY-type Zn-finger protein